MSSTGCSSIFLTFILTLLAYMGIQSPLAVPLSQQIKTPTYAPTQLASPAPGQLKGHIVFVSNRTGDYELFVMNADGSNVKQLTFDKTVSWEPSWSPDGKYILYTADFEGNREIFRMEADGSHPTRLTNDKGIQSFPIWSPDGRSIAFVSDRTGNHDIFVMRADGTGQRNLTNSQADERGPAWSPDGKLIAYDSTQAETSPNAGQIWIMDADGSHQTQLTHGPLSVAPSFSRDGKQIAFVGARDYPHSIFLMNPDGSKITTVQSSFVVDTSPSWSLDGKYIAVLHYEKSGTPAITEIYALSASGIQRIKLTNFNANSLGPSWGP